MHMLNVPTKICRKCGAPAGVKVFVCKNCTEVLPDLKLLTRVGVGSEFPIDQNDEESNYLEVDPESSREILINVIKAVAILVTMWLVSLMLHR